MPVVNIPELGEVSFPDSMSLDEITMASGELYDQKVAVTRKAQLGPDPIVKQQIQPGTRVVESTKYAEYEAELNRTPGINETASVAEGLLGSLEYGVKSAQQIAPVIVGKEISRLKTSEGFDPPEGIKQQAFRDIYGESFRGQIEKLDSSEDPEEKADTLYYAYRQRVRDLTDRRNAMLDVWTGVAEQLQKERQGIPKTQAQKELSQAITQKDKWSVFKKYPLQVASSIVLESLPPSIAGAIMGAPAGPGGVVAGIGLGGASTEYANTILGEASKAGYDISQEGQLSKFLDSPAYDAASDKALIRSGIIGVVDTATGSAAGLLIKPALKQGLKSTIAAAAKETLLVQGPGGAIGELGAQLATNKKGEKLDWFDISMEAIGEAVSAVPEAGIRIASESKTAIAAALNSSPATAAAVNEAGNVLRGTVEPVLPSPAPTPAAATSESGKTTTAPVTPGTEPPAAPTVTQGTAQGKTESEQALTASQDSEQILSALDRAIKLTDTEPVQPAQPQTKAQKIKTAIDGVIAKWQNAPEIQVVQNQEEFPEDVQKYINRVKKVGDLSGGVAAVRDSRGKIWLAADNISDEEHAKRLILHEAVGHIGIRGIIQDKQSFEKFMAGVAKRHADTQLGRNVRQIYGDNPVLIGEEIVARLAENPGEDPNLWQQVVQVVREFVRSKFNIEVSDNDIKVLISKAKAKIEQGQPQAATTVEAQQPRLSGDTLPDAPVVYRGHQPGFGSIAGFDLFNLTDTISPNLVKGSTVTADALRKAGFKVPAAEEAKAQAQRPSTEGQEPRLAVINNKQKELLQNFYKAANTIAGRTTYGRREGTAEASGYIATWSNGSKRWDISAGLGKVRPNQILSLDANQILVRANTLSDAKLIAGSLPVLPLDTFSFENNPLSQVGNTNKSESKLIQELIDFWKQEPSSVDVIAATERFMDKIRSPEQTDPRLSVNSPSFFETRQQVNAATANPDSDQILSSLDRAIELTDYDPTKVNEGVLGAPVWLAKGAANGALRIIRASYLGGKTIANAIKDGVDWLRTQNLPNFNETEAQSFLESAMAQRGAQTVKTDEERVQEELDVQTESTERKQFAGYTKAGQERPVENIADVTAINRQLFFDPTGAIDQDKIDQAWFLVTRLADPAQNESFNREIREASGRQIGPALLAHDLQHFAFRLVASGDLSLMHYLRDNWSTLATGGGLTTEAMGRGLRGLVTERADAEILAQLAEVFDWRKATTQKTLGISDEEWASIKQILDEVQITSAEVLDGMIGTKTQGGSSAAQDIQQAIDNVKQPASPSSPSSDPSVTPDDEESWQDKTARLVLDKMEASQTEWIRPDAPKNEVREYVKMALKDTTWPSVDSPDHTTRNVEAYLNKVTAELEVLGVSSEPARRLAWEIHRERLNRWSLKNIRDRVRNAPDKIVQSFLSGLTSLKAPATPNKIRSILNSARRRKLSFNDTIQPDEWKGSLADDLVSEGVDNALAARVADELYTAKIPEFATRQAAIFQRAGENVSGIVRSIVQALKEQPYRSQNVAWRRQVAKDYFLSSGLSDSRAEDASKVFDTVFVARESEARANAAKLLLAKKAKTVLPPGRERAMDKLKEAVRIGLTDPNRTWEDSIAALNGWKGFTEQEHNQLADWIEKLDGALPHEHAKLYTKINNLLATKLKASAVHELASFYSSNQLSGTGTQLLSYMNPAFASIVRSGNDVLRSIATGDFSRPLFSARALIEGLKVWSKEYSFAWKNDAYTSQSLKNIEKLQNLHSLMQRGLSDFQNESLPASRRAIGMVKYLASYVDIVRKSLQSADQAWQSTIKEWQALLGGRDLFRKSGLKSDEINDLLFDAYSAAEGYYHTAIAAGKDPLDAQMQARDKVWQDMEAMFKNKLGDTDGASVLTMARLESELEVGNHRGEGGFLNDWLTGLQGMQTKHPLMYRLLVGFPRVNFNILSRAAWYSPWGFKRLAVDSRERRAGVAPSNRSYKQSMVTELQRRQRLSETITGTIATGIVFALYASQMDKEDSEKLIWFDMDGPINPKERSIWTKSGHRPNSIGIKVGEDRLTINWSRGGLEAIQVPIAMASAYEDRRLNSKDPSSLEAAAKLASLLGFTATGRRDYTTEKGIAYSAASKMSGFVPFAGTLRTINKLAETRDTTTLNGIIIAATPVAPAFAGKPALNILGEPVTSDMTGFKLQRLGVPITINSPLPLYRLMADKSESPPQPRRDTLEKELRRLITDEEWYHYTETYGGHLKERMTEAFGGLVEMPPEVFNKQLERFSDQAKNKAMARIRSGQ